MPKGLRVQIPPCAPILKVFNKEFLRLVYVEVAELVDALDSKSSPERGEGSSPSFHTKDFSESGVVGRCGSLKSYCPKGRVGSNPTSRTKIYMRKWWNGIHSRLKICRLLWIEGSTPSLRTRFDCLDGGNGRHAGLRSQCL